MNPNVEKMRRFTRNIELQVEDIELERKGKTIVHYFDNGDVQGALLGIQDFYQKSRGTGRIEFNRNKFDERRALIRSLLSTKRLGPIRLLPPHQDELISKIRDFEHWTKAEWKAKVSDFTSQVGLSPERYGLLTIESADIKVLAEVLKADPDQAEKLFKVFQNLLPWYRRLGIWQRKQVIQFESTKLEPSILVSSEFNLLQQKLNRLQERRNKHINNVTDSLAWTYLFRLVKQFNQQDSTTVPRLYSPHSKVSLQVTLDTPIDGHALTDEEKALAESVNCVSSVGRLSVLRDDDYYLYKMALRPHSFSAPSEESVQAREDKDEELINLYRQVKNSIPSDESFEKGSDLSLASFERLLYEGKPIAQFIEELEKLTFFKSEWLRGELYNDVKEALEDVRQHMREVQQMQDALYHDKYQKAAEIAINDITGLMGTEVEAFSLIPAFWKSLNDEISNLAKRIHRVDSGVHDYYRDFGLLRYGFPKDVRSRVSAILDGLCSGDEDQMENYYVEFIQDYLNARFYDRDNVNTLMTSTAILLALRMYTTVFDLLEERKLDHFSLKIAHAEMFLQLGSKEFYYDKNACWRDCRNIMEELRQLEATSTEPEQKAELCVGLAYLFYHAWRFQDNDAQWRHAHIASSNHQSEHSKRWQYLIDSAITYASRAFKLLENTDRRQLKVYALNERVFFLIEGGLPNRIPEIKEAAELLAGSRLDSYLWQFRYDDTLARFYHRLAVHARTESEWREHITKALELIDEAKKRSDIDLQIESYYQVLNIYKTRGFSERKT